MGFPARSWLATLGLLLPGILAAGLGSGCRSLALDLHKPQYQVAVFQRAPTPLPPGSERVLTLTTLDGSTVTAFRWPILAPSVVPTATAVPRTGGGFDLLLELDQPGRLQWMQACAGAPGETALLTIDGIVFRAFPFPRPSEADDDRVRIPGPWTQQELDPIVRNTPMNYDKLHR